MTKQTFDNLLKMILRIKNDIKEKDLEAFIKKVYEAGKEDGYQEGFTCGEANGKALAAFKTFNLQSLYPPKTKDERKTWNGKTLTENLKNQIKDINKP